MLRFERINLCWFLIPLSVLPLVVGCSQGLSVLHSDRPKDNIALQRSENEQMLPNLVRVKSREPVSFLTVRSVSAHFRYTVSPDFFVRLNEGAGNLFGFGSDSSLYEISEEPTITYSPLQGAEAVSDPQESIPHKTRPLKFAYANVRKNGD